MKDYQVIEAILYRLKTGCQWRQLPMKQFFRFKYNWQSVYFHFQKWCKDGSWLTVWDNVLSKNKHLLDLSSIRLDGTVDTEGNIYVALTFSKKLSVFSPKGEKLDEISLPNGPVTNVTFGRSNYESTLLITAGKHLDTVQTNKKGYKSPFSE